MFSRICGKIWKNCSILQEGANPQKILTLNYQTRNWFARKTGAATGTTKKFGGGGDANQKQDDAKTKEKENRVLTKKEQIDLLTDLTTSDRELSQDEVRSLVRQDQRDRDMSINIINEASLGDYDKQLDEIIEKRIEEGRSANDIVQELLGLEKKAKKSYNQTQEDIEQQKQALEDSKKFNLFQMDANIQKQAKGLEQFYDILEQNKDKVEKLSLSELPTREQYKIDRKLTDSEKFQINAKAAAVGSYVASPFADRKNIPKEMLESRIFEQGDPDRLTFTQRRDIIVEAQESAMDTYEDRKAEKIKKKTILAQKLHAAEIDVKDDKRFRDLVEVDSKNTELQVEAPTDKEKRQLKRDFSDPKRNTFLMQEKRLERGLKMLGIDKYDEEDAEDYQVLAEISKEDIFIQKKLSEENAEFQKKLERRQRLKEVRKFEESLNQTKYKQDIDYTDPSQNFKGQNIPKHELYSDLPDLQKVNNQQIYLYNFILLFQYKRVSSFCVFMNIKQILFKIQLKELANKYNEMQVQDTHWDIHKKRSMNSLSSYIKNKFSEEKGNLASVTLFKQIQIDKISSNESMTVIYIFWQLPVKEKLDQFIGKLGLEQQALFKYKNMVTRMHEDKNTESKKNMETKINVRLNKFSNYFSGMICRDLGFKYGPEIRFSISTKDEKQKELKKEISDVIPEIMKKKLFEKYEKGEIEQKIHKGKMALDVDQAIIDLELKLQERIESDASLIAQAKAHEKRMKQEQQPSLTKEQRKAIRNKNNKDELGKKKKKKKGRKQQEFWDSLDAF